MTLDSYTTLRLLRRTIFGAIQNVINNRSYSKVAEDKCFQRVCPSAHTGPGGPLHTTLPPSFCCIMG